MALKVIGAGFGRNGTNSLRLALNDLGFGPCHHMFEVSDENPDQIAMWDAVADGRLRDWDKVFDGFQSQVDWPGCRYWRELADHYPDAKIILSVRDPDAWVKSFLSTIAPYMTKRGEHGDDHRNHKSEMAHKIIANQTFGGDFTTPTHLKQVYLEHIATVQATIPATRLLTYDVRQGWEPLCAFLGVPMPDAPFPNTNSSTEFQETTDMETKK